MSNTIWKGSFGPMLIAEIGGNHEGDFEYAKKLTQLAIESGADYVKFQLYTGDGLVNPVESPDRNKHFKKFELSKEQHIELAKMCQKAHVGYLASVWIDDALDWIDEYLDFYKIGSGDLTAYPMLEKIAKRRKPILLSTGLANEKEVLHAINFLKTCQDYYKEPDTIAVLQCTSMYPIPDADANLDVMLQLRKSTGCPTGYSDHTEGSYALEIATAMGAQVLEFHFTDTREGKTFRDHKVSLTCSEVRELSQRLEKIAQLKGVSEKRPLPIEIETGHVSSFRRGLYLNKDVSEGTVIQKEDLVALRPFHGMDPRDYQSIIGKKAVTSLKKFQKLSGKDFN